MIIRKYRPDDCKYLIKLFCETVHSVNANDYTEEQLNAWTSNINPAKWNTSLLEHYSIVATENNIITGFGDIDKTGYLDRLYVHKDYQRQGIASAICDELESVCAAAKIRTNASITAKPFFEKRGYKVIKEQKAERRGVILTNFRMEKT